MSTEDFEAVVELKIHQPLINAHMRLNKRYIFALLDIGHQLTLSQVILYNNLV